MTSLASLLWPAGLDQLVVCWRRSERRRALITGDYTASVELWDAGSLLGHGVGGHRVGLVRPWLLSRGC